MTKTETAKADATGCPGTWMETFTGRHFDFESPGIDQVCIEDIAHHLAMLCRYTGACRHMYTVAQHSLLVNDMMKGEGRELQFAGLMHDATEAYVGDMCRPLKIQQPNYQEVEGLVWDVICEKFDITWGHAIHDIVKRYDNIALKAEAFYLMESRGRDWGLDDIPSVIVDAAAVNPADAEAEFLATFRRYR